MLTPVNLGPVRRWRPYSWSTVPFRVRPWSELLDRYWELAELYAEELAIVEIIESVVGRGAAARLGGDRTIGGLHVVDLDHRTPPYSVISVQTDPGSGPRAATVTVFHTSSSGLRDEIVRPVDAAVALFWRFAIEKFGVHAPA